jgi:aminoglycoside phosphotransferase (APT) family kinase protein
LRRSSLLGIEPGKLEAWLDEHVPEMFLPVALERIPGGHSNLSYRIRDSLGRQWVLRRGPVGTYLPTAHDMRRECTVQRALKTRSPVPVPGIAAFCEDVSVIGSEFYIMDFVDGVVLRSSEAGLAYPFVLRDQASESLIDTLVALHAVDPELAGLGGLGRRDAYVERQLYRWHSQLDTSESHHLSLLEEVFLRLRRNVPQQQRCCVVHGDYRIDNVVLGPTGQVSAVLDWELATLGDPLGDLGMLLAHWHTPGERERIMTPSPTIAPGFLSREDLTARYISRTGIQSDDLGFYIALAHWKIACVGEGVISRAKRGIIAGDSVTVTDVSRDVDYYAEVALAMSDPLR